MHRLVTPDRSATSRRSRRALPGAVAASVTVLLALSACTSNRAPGTHSSAPVPAGTTASSSSAPVQSPTTTAAPAPAAQIITSPAGGKLSPADRVSVAITNGTLTSVTMTNPVGRTVAGALAANRSTWHSTEDLGYSRTYRITASGKNADGKPVTKKVSVTTLSPDNMTMAYLQRLGSYPLGNGSTYGVAIVPIVHFDEAIGDKAAAEKALTITTTPHVAGAWYWADDSDAHWRPEHYWPAGTKVTVAAKIYGVKLGSGLYGQGDTSASFTVGRRQVTIATDTAPKSVNKVHVYDAAGRVIRTMNTSMGKHTGTTANGQYINFYTLDGTYTVLDHEQPAKMCSATYGLPATAPGGYPCENIYNATKISTDGIYLHQLLTTIYAQNNGYDVSHGCLNLDASNSLWFFKHSMVGDPVVIHGAKGAPTLQVSEGGDWTVPWSTWVKGSAQT